MSIELHETGREPKTPGLSERFTIAVTDWVGSVKAFLLAMLIIIAWAATGPFVHPPFNDTWQLVINTGTTIITFLMVFIIQRSQNKDTLALQLKLNEIIAALRGASNRLINVEMLSEDEIRRLHERFCELSLDAQQDEDPGAKHSVEEEERKRLTQVQRKVSEEKAALGQKG